LLDIATINVIDLSWGTLDKDRRRILEWFEMCLRTSKLMWMFWILRESPKFMNQQVTSKWPIFIAIDTGRNITSLVVQAQGALIDKRATNGRGRTLTQYYDDLRQAEDPDEDMITGLSSFFSQNDQ
jgi:hypothetical protein